jgi:hypothetical protein
MFMFRMLRLQGYGMLEATVCLLAHRICGTPIYWHPKHERERIKALRGVGQ